MSAAVRLFIFCEGQTEETFAQQVLSPHFLGEFATYTYPLLLPNVRGAHARRHKGGWISYRTARHFMHGIMQQHHRNDVWFTTLFDFYALPADYPRPAAPLPISAREKVLASEVAMQSDLLTDGLWRFTPHLQLHEFEALLFTDIGLFVEEFPERRHGVAALQAEVAGVAPEDVNDGAETHPSRRIIRHIPEYDGRKASAGPILASRIGLDRLRRHCGHFAEWLSNLERQLVEQADGMHA